MAKLAAMQSLRDKLLKAGLVSEDQAKQAEETAKTRPPRREDRPFENRPREARSDRPDRSDRPQRFDRPQRPERPQRPDRPPPPARAPSGPLIRARPAGPPPPKRESLSIPKLPPLPGSKEAQRLEARKQVEQDRKLRELVLASQVPIDIGATVFYFMTRKGKLRRLTLTDPQAKQLENGELAVVERPDPGQIEHALVPPEAAEQVLQVSERAVRFFNRKEGPIGFMSDEDLRTQQEQEARAEISREERLARQAREGAAASEAGVSEAGKVEAGEAGASEPSATEAGATEAGATEAGADKAAATEASTTETGATEAKVTEAPEAEAGATEGGSVAAERESPRQEQ